MTSPVTVQMATFFCFLWRIAPPLWYAFSESWCYVDYCGKIEKRWVVQRVYKVKFQKTDLCIKTDASENIFVNILMILGIGIIILENSFKECLSLLKVFLCSKQHWIFGQKKSLENLFTLFNFYFKISSWLAVLISQLEVYLSFIWMYQ